VGVLRKREEKVKIWLGAEGAEQAAKSSDIIIVVDVLRASSTIITAIANGALSVIPVLTVKQAIALARATPDSILGGERNGLRIRGFGLGNSPLEYTKRAVQSKNVVFTTTNCTKVLERCKQLASATEVFIGAFLNATAIASSVKRLSTQDDKGVSIVQAGSAGKSALDDLVCAELIKNIIENRVEQQPLTQMNSIISPILRAILSNTRHGKYLISRGFQNDIWYCSQVDRIAMVPWLQKRDGLAPSIIRDPR
jgi:2-phosphosulfolactate phosphatase